MGRWKNVGIFLILAGLVGIAAGISGKTFYEADILSVSLELVA
jgi:hypothetical protein